MKVAMNWLAARDDMLLVWQVLKTTPENVSEQGLSLLQEDRKRMEKEITMLRQNWQKGAAQKIRQRTLAILLLLARFWVIRHHAT